MFKYNKLTTYEKLVIANSYVKLLKTELRKQETATLKIKQDLFEFVEFFQGYTKGTKIISSYRRDMKAHVEKTKNLLVKNEKLEKENYELHMAVKELKELLKTKK